MLWDFMKGQNTVHRLWQVGMLVITVGSVQVLQEEDAKTRLDMQETYWVNVREG